MDSTSKEPKDVFSPAEIMRLKLWIWIYESPIRAFFENHALATFKQFDLRYFDRTAQTEEAYLTTLLSEVKREATLRFTEAPNGANKTMFHYPEKQRVAGYKTFEAEFVRRWADKENRRSFKAYVARRLGLRVPPKE